MTLTPPQHRSRRTQPFSGDYCTSGGMPSFGLQNGWAFNETIDPTLKTPYSDIL